MNIYSTSKAIYHVDRIKLLQQNKPIAPTLLQADLEAYCNDNCEFCSYRKDNGYNTEMLKLIDATPGNKYFDFKPIGRMTRESGLPESFAYELPKQMKEAGIPAIELTGGGEPTIWKYFDILLDNLIKEGIEIGLVTNASTLSDRRIDLLGENAVWIRFSMDSSNAALHQRIHRTPNLDFERRILCIRKLVEKNGKATLGISFIITPDNIEDILPSAKFYKELGVDNIRYSWLFDKEGHAGLTFDQIEQIKLTLRNLKTVYDDERFKVIFEEGRIDLYSSSNDFPKCYMNRFVWSLGANSLVYHCCITKYMPGFEIGDLRKNTLKEIIELSHKNVSELNPKKCPPCWLQNRIKIISEAVEKPLHSNFI